MSQPDLVFLSAYLPAQVAHQAGEKTAFRNLCFLAERYRIHLISFRSAFDSEASLSTLRKICAKVALVDVNFKTRLLGLARNPMTPLAVAFRRHPTVSRLINQWSSEVRFERAHFEWSQMGQYTNLLRQVPERSLYVHDVMHQWLGRKAVATGSAFWKWEAGRARNWELAAYSRFTRIYVPSAKDSELLQGASPQLAPILRVLPLHFDVYTPGARRANDKKLALFFWGALGRHENASAANWIVQHLLPGLRNANLQFSLVVGGSNPPEDLLAYRSEEVSIPGFINDPAPLFAQADVAVLPLLEGAGVKVKVLECLSSGIPVLTTVVGSEGIDAGPDDGLLTLPLTAEAFVTELLRFSRDKALLMRLREGALAWAHKQHQDLASLLLH